MPPPMAKAAFNGRYSKVETPAAAPIPALEALPPSVVSLDGGRDSWLHAEGATLTMLSVKKAGATWEARCVVDV